MELPTYFVDFLKEIRPTDDQRSKMQDAHHELRDRLGSDDDLKDLIVSTFIQGSYRRFTGTRPQDSQQCDVDIIAVTTMHERDYNPKAALEKFRAFLKKYYAGKYLLQGRSWGINVCDDVSLDLVPTSAPSEAVSESIEWTRSLKWDFPVEPERIDSATYKSLLLGNSTSLVDTFSRAASQPAWKQEPLRIPDREADKWDDTHPLEQINWTWLKSKNTGGHYVNVVKAIKWWRRLRVKKPKYPKSYPLEHLIGDCCPDGISSVAIGITLTLEAMEATFRPWVDSGMMPFLADRGVPGHNVLGRVTFDDFSAFMNEVQSAAVTARKALNADSVTESANLWRELFGEEFPAPPDDNDDRDSGGNGNSVKGVVTASDGFTPREQQSQISGGRFG